MEIAKNYLERFRPQPTFKVGSSSKQLLLSEIYQYFKPRLKGGEIAGLLRDKGETFVRETFEQLKKDNPKDRLSVFLWRLGRVRTKWHINR